MLTQPCGHVANPSTSRACPHLAPPPEDPGGHVRVMTGHGMEFDLVCEACDRAGEPVELTAICEGCAERAFDDGDLVAWRGSAGIPERPEPMPPVYRWSPPHELGEVIDLAPVWGDRRSRWLALTADGRVAELAPDDDRATTRATLTLPREPDHKPYLDRTLRHRLHASACGRFAAVVNDYGRLGLVVDLDRDGAVTMELHGGGYRADTVPFSLAFAVHDGRPVVVHRTDWNRLDVSDPESGRLLTGRAFAKGEDLDYFHGRIVASPGGAAVADDGWIWSPVGVPLVWSLRRWLDEDVYESERGPSLHRLCFRDYHWDTPLCFVGETAVAVSGIGDDDIAMLPGTRVFSVGTGDELTAFAGPQGAFFSDGVRLYSAHADGLHVWDPVTGHRTGTVPGFAPACLHHGTGELAAFTAGDLVRWRR
ncbi:hypothetical protein KZZ52_22150 [Dactylosporangium sp. AC04546]|uniref:hypothetical protein n=1 Tax=Dactylosporangium sp. AC04546 TaxID=2862460 RepID=UPI001EDF7FDF|nr:hypothetical protein [Dactylosporangium sp. AC04546]WVK87982.1 hypothetical protein KZZ52_22150 [Dactylosporangium sp. AC04546]